MYQIIENFCKSEQENGLMLIDMSTGSGKTYNVIKYIFDASQFPENQSKKFFFITTLKKNLPIEDLKNHFENAGKLSLFKEKFLFLDSNSDSVIENFTVELKKEIPIEFKKLEEYKHLDNDIEVIKNQENNVNLRKIAASIKENLRTKTEPEFRKTLENILEKKYSTVEKRLTAIKTDKDWQWVGKLYPSVFTRDKQIIFMSVDKFLARNSTIVEPSYQLYNSDIINGSYIFIDEFDATKETMLNNIITNGLRDKIDYLDLFNAIYSALLINSFPKSITTPSKQRSEGQYKDQSLVGVLEELREKADKLCNEFSLRSIYKTEESISESKNFLFQDYRFVSVLDGNKRFITSGYNSTENVNYISFSDNKPTSEKNNIQALLGKLRGFVGWFRGSVNILATNYLQQKNENHKDGDNKFTYEAAVRTILSLFHLSDRYKDYLTTQILMDNHKERGGIAGPDFDLSFYQNGFRYYSFIDNPNHDMQSGMLMYLFRTTPEKILLRFCEKAKVIGISATATIPTVIGNYDLDYLRCKMQGRFVEISEEDKTRLKTDFENNQVGYKNINIHTKLLGMDDDEAYSVESWYDVFEDDELCNWAFERVKTNVSESNDYNQRRYLRIALAYKEFAIHNDIQSFLCVLTKHPRPYDSQLNLDVLIELFTLILKKYNPSIKADKTVVQLDGAEYDLKKDEIIKRLSSGEKLFVISVYQTIGAGQNLQYPIPKELSDSIIKTNGWRKNGIEEKDFDAIYIDKPTNILVQLGENLSEEDFVKYLFHVDFLQEYSELSIADCRTHIKKAFKTYINGHTSKEDYAANIYNSNSVLLLHTKIIIQAIGRICRTNNKRKNIYIYADSRIKGCIDNSVIDGRSLNKEFLKLASTIENSDQHLSQKEYCNAANLTSSKVYRFINNILNEDWTSERIVQWNSLRTLVLKYPTLSYKKFASDFPAHNFYFELPKVDNHYFFSEDEDYKNVDVSFSKDSEHKNRVSSQAARLDALMMYMPLKEHFEKNGYCISFVPQKYIMSPPLFNNIYKGALGEVAGLFLFSHYNGYDLEQTNNPELFELFDYKLKDKAVYVDFKNWGDSTDFENASMLEKIASKAKKCECHRIIIANVISKKDIHPTETRFNEVDILKIPSLLKFDGTHTYINQESWDSIREFINATTD